MCLPSDSFFIDDLESQRDEFHAFLRIKRNECDEVSAKINVKILDLS
jgi:hypothetical protein